MTNLEAYSDALGRLVAGLLILGAFAFSLGAVKKRQEEKGPVHPKRVHRARGRAVPSPRIIQRVKTQGEPKPWSL